VSAVGGERSHLRHLEGKYAHLRGSKLRRLRLLKEENNRLERLWQICRARSARRSRGADRRKHAAHTREPLRRPKASGSAGRDGLLQAALSSYAFLAVIVTCGLAANTASANRGCRGLVRKHAHVDHIVIDDPRWRAGPRVGSLVGEGARDGVQVGAQPSEIYTRSPGGVPRI
jgi:hypothetical protein